MTTTTTPKLALVKPVLGSAEPIRRVNHLNNNLDILEALLDDLDEKSSLTTFTPTAVAGFTVGNGIITGRHMKVGSLAVVKVEFTAGSTSTFTGVFEVGSFPNAAVQTLGGVIMIGGSVYEEDVSVPANYVASLRAASSTSVWLVAISGRSSNVIPFTWAVNDIFKFLALYECAP